MTTTFTVLYLLKAGFLSIHRTAPWCAVNLAVMVSGCDLAFLEQVTSLPPSVPSMNLEGIVLSHSR